MTDSTRSGECPGILGLCDGQRDNNLAWPWVTNGIWKLVLYQAVFTAPAQLRNNSTLHNKIITGPLRLWEQAVFGVYEIKRVERFLRGWRD